MATAIDTRIAAAKEELRQIRESWKEKQDDAMQAIASLHTKREALTGRIGEVLNEGLELSDYASIMLKVLADENTRDSMRFGHQVLLLMTIHRMEALENLLRMTCKQNRKLVKSVERRKQALREQNSEHEFQFMNRLSKQYEGMRKLDDDFRQAIHAQEVVISRLEWKSSIPAFPMPVFAATTSEYLHEQQSAILSISHGRAMQETPTSASAKCASSMRHMMELDGAFPPPTDEDLIPTIRQESLADAIYSPEDDEPPVDFSVSMDVLGGLGGRGGSLRRRRMRRSVSFDSADSMSTAGEELLQGIQSFFTRVGRKGRGDRNVDNSDDCSTDN